MSLILIWGWPRELFLPKKLLESWQGKQRLEMMLAHLHSCSGTSFIDMRTFPRRGETYGAEPACPSCGHPRSANSQLSPKLWKPSQDQQRHLANQARLVSNKHLLLHPTEVLWLFMMEHYHGNGSLHCWYTHPGHCFKKLLVLTTSAAWSVQDTFEWSETLEKVTLPLRVLISLSVQ